MVLRIGEMTHINLYMLHRVLYQDYINDTHSEVVDERNKNDEEYFKVYDTMVDNAKYTVQLKQIKPAIAIDGKKIETEIVAVYALKLHAMMAQELMELEALTSKE
eukprot:13170628-Ditylum_brightwellii.AAC.1